MADVKMERRIDGERLLSHPGSFNALVTDRALLENVKKRLLDEEGKGQPSLIDDSGLSSIVEKETARATEPERTRKKPQSLSIVGWMMLLKAIIVTQRVSFL